MRNTIFRKFVLPVVLVVVSAFSICAQSRQGNRWLIVMDTSLPMERRDAATQTAVQSMLLSGMSGQLRSGDTLGMWTFNEQLHSGEFPLQLWLPEVRQTIAARAGQFTKQLHYEKTARFDKIIPAINHLVTNSEVLTVILITDGSGKIEGTPFDKTINAALKEDYAYQKKLGVPFLIALRGVGGKFSDYTVNLAPWPVAFAPLPPEPERVIVKTVEPEPKPEPVIEPRPAPVVPSLILSGKKTEPAPPVEPVTPPVEKTAVIAPNPEPITTKQEIAIAPAVPQTQPVISEPAPTPAPAIVEMKPLSAPQVETLPAREAIVAVASLKENTPPPSTPTPAKGNVASAITTVPAKPLEASVPEASSVQAAVVTPIGTSSGSQKNLLIGLGLLVAALVVGIFWLRRSRHAGQASLITRSLDKDKK